jgi:hypothetical protein
VPLNADGGIKGAGHAFSSSSPRVDTKLLLTVKKKYYIN